MERFLWLIVGVLLTVVILYLSAECWITTTSLGRHFPANATICIWKP